MAVSINRVKSFASRNWRARSLKSPGMAPRLFEGSIARDIVQTERRLGGIMTLTDLAHYRAKIRKPLVGHFRGYTLLSTPPPSSDGVALIEMLNILDPLKLDEPDSYDSMHLVVEAMRRAYADRAAYLGDADFVSIPVEGLVSESYAARQ